MSSPDVLDVIGGEDQGTERAPLPVRSYLRFVRSEFRITFWRRRNQLLLAVVALFPLIIGIGLKAASPHGGNGSGPGALIFSVLAGNGIFLVFVALNALLILVLPITVSVIAGDSIAGEAGHGTLRYLLTVPAGRTRLLTVKYLTIVAFGTCATFVVSVVGLVAGVALFTAGPVNLLSGATISLADGLLRVLLVTLYVSAAMAALGAIGLAISTLTEHAIGAIAAIVVFVVASEVIDAVPQFGAVAPYLPTHWWTAFSALLQQPVDTAVILRGLLSFAVYGVLAGTIAWARLGSADVTS